MNLHFSAEQLVTALYLAALGRKPDEAGLRAHMDALTSKKLTLDDLANGLFNSEENMRARQGVGLRDTTQFGELRHLLDIFMRIGVRSSILVDVGARGAAGSNSFNLLHDFAWTGVLIEANPSLIERLRQEFSGLSMELLNCAIGMREGKMPFYIGVNDDVSSLLPEHAAAWGPIRAQVDVEVRRLGDVLTAQRIPHDFDLLSLDIEGMDVPVLNDLISNTPYRPRVIIIEASYDFKTKSISEAGLNGDVQGSYRLAGQTNANLILVAADETYHTPNPTAKRNALSDLRDGE